MIILSKKLSYKYNIQQANIETHKKHRHLYLSFEKTKYSQLKHFSVKKVTH